MKVCKTCGQLNSNDCNFCCKCGGKSFVFQEEVVCAHCGAANDASFAFCIQCGKALKIDGKDAQNRLSLAENDVAKTETVKCPNCGADVKIAAVYCSNCGTSVASLNDHRVVKRKICPHCGKLNKFDATYCSYCFCDLKDAQSEDLQVVHSNLQIGDETIKQPFLQDGVGKKKICSGCGAANSVDEVFCSSCGLRLDAKEQKKYCPNCGEENPANGKFCIKCQWSFDGVFPDISKSWVCGKCKNINSVNDMFCIACGARREKGGNNQ